MSGVLPRRFYSIEGQADCSLRHFLKRFVLAGKLGQQLVVAAVEGFRLVSSRFEVWPLACAGYLLALRGCLLVLRGWLMTLRGWLLVLPIAGRREVLRAVNLLLCHVDLAGAERVLVGRVPVVRKIF